MAQTSIHLRPCKQSSEIHNMREKELDYVRTDLSHKNEWWSAVSSLGKLRSEISAMVKEKTGRKMQAKAEPLREGVVVIQEGTTMEQLQELGRRFQERFGVTPVQIAIHRDEGHWKGEDWKPNLHAHIVFDWYNHATGKSIKTSKLDAVDMQTITAEVLGMERGVSSEKKHLESARYKAQARQKEIEDLEQQVECRTSNIRRLEDKAEELEERIEGLTKSGAAKEEAISTIKEFGSKMRDRISGKDKREKKELTDKLKKITEIAKNNYAVASEEHEKRIKLEKMLESTSASLKSARNEINRLREDIAPTQTKANNLQREIDNIKKNLPEVLPQATAIGLDVDAAVTLASGRELQIRSIKTTEGKTLSMEGGEPIRLRWNKRIEAYLALTWYAVKEWCREALRSPWCAVDGVSNNPRRRRGMHL